MKQNQVRIIGGSLRGRKVQFNEFPEEIALRPTPDRVRETLFNWLSQTIVNANCLDAFGGSGALSFESVSRGTSNVTIIEQDQKIAHQIQENAKRFNINPQQLTISSQNALDYLAKTTQQFDIIFLDPPFQQNLLIPCMQLITERHLLRENGYVYAESNEPILPNEHWAVFRSKKAGSVYFGLFIQHTPVSRETFFLHKTTEQP